MNSELNKRLRAVTLVLAIGLATAPVQFAAADRALLIGVGAYNEASPLPNLPGIDVDLANMRQIAELLGFQRSQIRELSHEAATSDAIRHQIREWLVNGTGPGERVLLYYSGHGARVRDRGVQDELDGWDEVIAGYDVRLMQTAAGHEASGVVLDDELNTLLASMVGRDVVAIIDACTSGSATRRGPPGGGAALASNDLGWAHKSGELESYPEAPRISAAVQTEWLARQSNQTWISLSAAEDRQMAIATSHGSLFTQALYRAVLAARGTGGSPSWDVLHGATTEVLSKRLGTEAWAPYPVLNGPSALRSKGIRLTSPNEASPVRQRLQDLLSEEQHPMLSGTRQTYFDGERVHLRVNVPGSGFLNVVAVDANDQARLLFPNSWHPENRVAGPQTLVLGDSELGFHLEAEPPHGESFVIAIYTDESWPLNFYREALAEFGEPAGVERGLAKLSSSAVSRTKGIRVTAPRRAYRASGIRIHVMEGFSHAKSE